MADTPKKNPVSDFFTRNISSKTFWTTALSIAYFAMTKQYTEIPALLAILFARDTMAAN